MKLKRGEYDRDILIISKKIKRRCFKMKKELKIIQSLRNRAENYWNKAFTKEYNSIEYINLHAKGDALWDLQNEIAKENNINLNNYCDKYGKMYFKKVIIS